MRYARGVGAFLYGPVHGFMLWNLFLAAHPRGPRARCSFTTSRSPARRASGGSGSATWVLFLPNAPYVLTDVVHMVHDIQRAHSDTWAYLVIATYGVLFAFGLASYAFSLQLFRRFLHRTVRARLDRAGDPRRARACVLAMYLGRVIRLNSWDVVTRAAGGRGIGAARSAIRARSCVLAVMFVVVGVGVFVAAAVGDKVVARARRWL